MSDISSWLPNGAEPGDPQLLYCPAHPASAFGQLATELEWPSLERLPSGSALERPSGGNLQERTFAVADLNDWRWSAAAELADGPHLGSESWPLSDRQGSTSVGGGRANPDFPAITAGRDERQLLPTTVVNGRWSNLTANA